MKSIYDIRRFNAQLLCRYCGTMADFSDRTQRAQTQVSRLIGKNPTRNIGEQLARHIEHSFCLPEHWLDHQHHRDMESLDNSLKNYLLKQDKHLKLHEFVDQITLAIKYDLIDEVVFTQLEEIVNRLSPSFSYDH
ncbi:hypothetical protein [Thiomicrospira sp. WB1]|uniref:hypothetical protein n=1 Tax=Thiomicrospira sp. WB1 TaxID=1685380 RepID=UPI000747FBA6|nr:hypothetical protein [Thiomicrospira sp. WB1]KUJ72615.1 hypothetical protein AVO41_02095 [Thiomicrospira sp. WB1]